jgi:hypothetical protein
MFRGDWGKYAKIAGLAAVILIGSLFTYAATIPYAQSLKQEAANKARIESDNAEYAIKWVCSSPLAEKDCVAKTRQTENENARNAEDLGAQKLSAWWAQVMAVAALIGMALSAVGVWLVYTTFRETKRSADLANSSLEYTKIVTQRQIEAFVYIGSATYHDKPSEQFFHDQEFGIVTFTVQNFGKTMAYDVSLTMDVLAPDFKGDPGKIVVAEEKFGGEFYPAGRIREYRIEFQWRDDLRRKIIANYGEDIEIQFVIAYKPDSQESETFTSHEGRMVAYLSKDSDRADFVPPYKGWHTSD